MDDRTDDETNGWKGRPPQADKTKDIIYEDKGIQVRVQRAYRLTLVSLM
jgi:hypothetical protein